MRRSAINVLERHGLGGTWWFDLETRTIWWSRGIYRIHGVDPREYTPTLESVVTFYEPESRARVKAALEQVLEQGTGWSLTLLLRRGDGQLRYVHSVAHVEARPDRAPLLVGAFFDVHEPTVERIERQTQEQRVQEQSRRWRIASENAGHALIDFDDQFYRLCGALAQQIGFTGPGEFVLSCERWRRCVHPQDRAVRQQRLQAHLAGETESYVSEYRLRLPGTREIWVREAARRTHVDDDNANDENPSRLIGTLSDISERKRAERAVFRAKALAEGTFEAIGEGLVRVNRHGRITEVNSAACTLLGCCSEKLVRQRFVDAVELYDATREQRLPDPVMEVLRHGRRIRVPIFTRLRRIDGVNIPIVDSTSPIRDENGRVQGAVFVFQDISEARRMTDELVHQTRHDELTGLPNRRGFEQGLDAAWRRVRAGVAQSYIIYFDLDRFKAINDNYGHPVGDVYLRQAARAFRSIMRDSDLLARVGGDEFAAIVDAKDVESVEAVAEKLIAAVDELAFTSGGRAAAVGVSLGVAALDPGLPSSETALIHADAALYMAKNSGRGQYCFYDQTSTFSGRRADDA